MELYAQIAIAALIVAGTLALIWSIRGIMLLPIRLPAGEKVFTLLRVKGNMPHMEQTVEGLLWLRKNGTVNMEIVIVDMGMSGETKRIAAILSKENKNVTLCGAADLEALLGER